MKFSMKYAYSSLSVQFKTSYLNETRVSKKPKISFSSKVYNFDQFIIGVDIEN